MVSGSSVNRVKVNYCCFDCYKTPRSSFHQEIRLLSKNRKKVAAAGAAAASVATRNPTTIGYAQQTTLMCLGRKINLPVEQRVIPLDKELGEGDQSQRCSRVDHNLRRSPPRFGRLQKNKIKKKKTS